MTRILHLKMQMDYDSITKLIRLSMSKETGFLKIESVDHH